MSAIPVRELSHYTARALARVKSGETVEITERGRVIGRIVPVDPQLTARERLVSAGRLRPATGSLERLVAELERRIRVEAVDTSSAATNALMVSRDEERY